MSCFTLPTLIAAAEAGAADHPDPVTHQVRPGPGVAAYLQQWGDRIHRSVYVCMVAPEELSELISRVEQMIDPDTDAVHLLPTCATCWSRLVLRGQADAAPDRPYWAAL
jgi:CRISPR-associated protein Cas2